MAMQTFDSSNISGAALARIGRAVLGMTPADQGFVEKKLEGYIMDSYWLDERVEEVCRKGRL